MKRMTHRAFASAAMAASATFLVSAPSSAQDFLRSVRIVEIGKVVGLAGPCGYTVDQDKVLAAVEKDRGADHSDLSALTMGMDAAKFEHESRSAIERSVVCKTAAAAAKTLGLLR